MRLYVRARRLREVRAIVRGAQLSTQIEYREDEERPQSQLTEMVDLEISWPSQVFILGDGFVQGSQSICFLRNKSKFHP